MIPLSLLSDLYSYAQTHESLDWEYRKGNLVTRQRTRYSADPVSVGGY